MRQDKSSPLLSPLQSQASGEFLHPSKPSNTSLPLRIISNERGRERESGVKKVPRERRRVRECVRVCPGVKERGNEKRRVRGRVRREGESNLSREEKKGAVTINVLLFSLFFFFSFLLFCLLLFPSLLLTLFFWLFSRAGVRFCVTGSH